MIVVQTPPAPLMRVASGADLILHMVSCRYGVRVSWRFAAILAAVALVVSIDAAAAGPTPRPVKLTPAQRACAARAIGAALTAKFEKGQVRLTTKQQAKLAPCLQKRPAPPTSQTPSDAWLTAVPFDLSLVKEMSRFRSCTGHDFSGYNIRGEVERDSSMKHYVTLTIAWLPADSAKGYAPFDGRVTSVRTGGLPGQSVYIESDAGKPWQFFFAHVTPLVKEGDRVKAGDVVATFPPADAQQIGSRLRPTVAFDTGLHSVVNGRPAYETFFLHMTDAVLRHFAAQGFTPEKLIVSKETREATPCKEYNRSDATDYVQATG